MFLVKEEIAHGEFSKIFLGENRVKKKPVALKFEKNSNEEKHLEHEYQVYQCMKGIPGIPNIYWFGSTTHHNVLAMDLLGKSVLDLMKQTPDKKFSLKTSLMLFDQMISLIQVFHSVGFVHRSIKPNSFLTGINENSSQFFIIDFALAEYYQDPDTKVHARLSTDVDFPGNLYFASINAHMGFEQSRRDDLESLGYVIIYLLKGLLPWVGLKSSKTVPMADRVFELKLSASYESLCSGLPNEFVQYFQIVRNLSYEEEPPYDSIKTMFRNLFKRKAFVYDYKYDWIEKKELPEPLNLNCHNTFIGSKDLQDAEQEIVNLTKRSIVPALSSSLLSTTQSVDRRKNERTVFPKAVKQKRAVSSMASEMMVINYHNHDLRMTNPT